MLDRWQPAPLLILLLVLILAGCGDGREPGSSGPVASAPPEPLLRSTQTALPVTIAPTWAETETLSTSTAEAAVAIGTRAVTATDISATAPVETTTDVATATPVATPSQPPSSPTPTATPRPTSTLTRSPTPTPSPTATLAPAPTIPAAATPFPPADPKAIQLGLQPVASGLDRPVGIANAGDESGRIFVLEKIGRVRIVRDGRLVGSPYLDITDRVGSSASEQGLLGLAFHPNHADNGLFFVNYTDQRGDTVIARFSVSADADRADPASETQVLTFPQPAGNHNGGHLAFGPDGFLYIGTGDGGGAGDQYGNGQNGGTLLGAMLRLDVDSAQPYAIPAGNPFVGDPSVRDEIWALGLRNPWRYSFDRLTGDLYIADVGQNQYEEVNHQAAASPGGQNYGWPIMEGMHCYPEDRNCAQTGLSLPVAEYRHAQGCSVTGGYVYRGGEFPPLKGIYIFGDYCSGRIWGLAPSEGGIWRMAEVAATDTRISSFGEDEAGELYLLDMDGGALFRLTAPQS